MMKFVINLSSQGVSAVKMIMIRGNDILVPTNTFILTFRKHTLPQSIKAGYLNIPVDPYVPNPLRCFRCQNMVMDKTLVAIK